MNHDRAVQIAGQIPGMMWPRELSWLYNTFGASTSHAEIGSYCGRSLFASAAGMANGSHIIAVDSTILTLAPEEWTLGVLNLTISIIPPGISAKHWRVSSAEAAVEAHEAGMQFDSIFIDADHREAGVELDIQAWRPMIKGGGIMAGHDYWPQFPGVMSAVNKHLPAFEVVPNTRIWWSRV